MRRAFLVGGLVLAIVGPAPVGAQDTVPVQAGQPVAPVGRPKSIATARFLGIVPGAGHLYAGEATHALAFGLGTIAALAINSIGGAHQELCPAPPPVDEPFEPANDGCGDPTGVSTVTIVALVGLVGWSVHDAGHAARRWNRKHGHSASAMFVPTVGASRGRSGTTQLELGLRAYVR